MRNSLESPGHSDIAQNRVCQNQPQVTYSNFDDSETPGCFRQPRNEVIPSSCVDGISVHIEKNELQAPLLPKSPEATICSTMINLFSTITGAGMLGLPYAFANTGVFMGLGWFLISGFGEAYAIHLLVKCAIKEQKYSFRELAKEAMKFKWAEHLVDAMLALNCFGCCCGYLIIIGHLLPDIFLEFVHPPENSLLLNHSFWVTIVSWVIAFPLSCLKTLDSLKFTSTLGLMGIIYVSLVTVLFAYRSDIIGDPCENKPHCPGEFNWGFTDNFSNVLRVLSIFCFSFMCAQNIPDLTLELKDRSEGRMGTSVYGALSMSIALYFLTALAGYKAFGSSVDADLLRSFPINRYSSAARIAITTVLCTSFPLQMYPTKNSVCNLVFGKNANACSNFRFYSTTFLLVLTSWSIGVYIHDLSIILALVGATTAIFIGYGLPAFFYIKLFSKGKRLTCDMVMSYIILTVSLILSPGLIAIEIYSFFDFSSTK